MPNLVPPLYPLDLTGINVNNKIIDEQHTLSTRKIRSLVPNASPFFTESLKVYDNASNTLLTKDVNYSCVDVIGLPTAQSGKEICAIILITDQTVSNSVRIEYQTLGSYYVKSYSNIKLMMDNLSNDNRPVSWPDIVNRPATFDPNMHLHRLGDLIGFEYAVASLEQLKIAIGLGDDIGHDQILKYIDDNINAMMSMFNDNETTNVNLALAKATDAQSSSLTALNNVTALSDTVSALLTTTNSVLNSTYDLVSNMENAEEQVLALFNQ